MRILIADDHPIICIALGEMRGARIDVLNSNGVVTLTGIVPTVEARERAEAIVRGMDGVAQVINELNVV